VNIPTTELIARAIIRSNDKILVVRQRGRGWSFLPGGHVEPGEPVQTALLRELVEEIGAEGKVTRFAGVIEHGYTEDDTVHHEINMVFEAQIASTDVESREDHLEFEWLPIGDLADSDVRPRALKDALLDGAFTTPVWRSWVR
jgi:ADP-ribose pyrophosphatase YjhB (NUDIX family)